MSKERTIPFNNPATGVQFGEVAMTRCADVHQARRELAAAAPKWAKMGLRTRIRILQRLKAAIIDGMDEITAVINQDAGKSRQDALSELFVTVDLMTQYLKHAPRWLGRKRVSPGLQIFKRSYIDYKPHGVVAVISPWNYPFVLTIPPVFSALLAGNAVMVKPSEVTAATGVIMERLFQSLPELAPYVRFIHGDGQVGAEMVASEPDLIYLTGSIATGKKVMAAAANTLTPVIFELGSKDPMIVLADADIEAAAKWGVWGAFYNTGQTCVSVERVYVVPEVYDGFVRAVVAEAQKLKIGYSPEIDNENHIGPFTFSRQPDIVMAHLQDAVEKGARIILGGKQDEMFMGPTVVVDVDHSMDLMRDETFGPIMPIMKVADAAHAVQLANHSHMGLGASIWSSDLKRGQQLATQIEAGTVNINDTIVHFAVPHLPFGGVKQSGVGRTHGKADLLQFTTSQATLVGNPPYPFDVATIMRKPGNYKLGAALIHLFFGTTIKQRLRPVRAYLAEQNRQLNWTKAATALGLTAAFASFILAFFRIRR